MGRLLKDAAVQTPSVPEASWRDLEQVSFRHLISLCVLHRTRNMRKTAALLGRTQPAISLQIRTLEAVLGVDILVHRRGRVAFTANGMWLAGQAHRLVGDMEAVMQEAQAMAGKTLRVGMTEDFFHRGMRDLSPLLEGVEVELHLGCSQDLLGQVQAGTLDVVLAKSPTPLRTAWRAWRHDMAWAASNDEVAQATDEPMGPVDLVLLPETCLYHQAAVSALERAGRRYAVRSVCPGWDGVFRVLERGGLTVVARDWPGAAAVHPEPEALPTLPKAALNIMFARRQPGQRRDACLVLARSLADGLGMTDDLRLA